MDHIDDAWESFKLGRSRSLYGRFSGWYRAVVVETNDPLQFHRVRFRCPELHNSDLKPDECPWAVPGMPLGGKNASTWISAIIGDVIWVTWEKDHPYGPIYVGAADGTRRRRYALESIYTNSPLAVKEDGSPDEVPADFLKDYLPKDKRPMSMGYRDRYGNIDISKSVGFFPKEHDIEPAPTGVDAVGKRDFDTGATPEANNPDCKYMIRATKYGVYEIMSDVGYVWKKDGDNGEFKGNFADDISFEITRTNYYTKLFNESAPKDEDQRRYEVRTRYGHKFEMRDVGWNKTRDGEFSEPRTIAKRGPGDFDERWIKLRTKGGHLIQLWDAGSNSVEDVFVKRKLIDETGPLADGETDWMNRDARQLRFVSRYGFKMVLDDRGSDPIDAAGKEIPHGNGMLLKGRRSYDGKTQRGFGFEYNEKDELNSGKWYSPKSKIIEINDNRDYMMVCTDTKGDISRPWQKLRENEFALKNAMTETAESDTYHLKLDKFNGYLRLKTAAGGDNGRRPFGGSTAEGERPFVMSNADTGINQGLEARDNRQGVGVDGAWLELVDIEDRGLWFSKKYGVSVFRGVGGGAPEQYISVNNMRGSILVRNSATGPVQIFSNGDVQFIGNNITFSAINRISFNAEEIVSNRPIGTGDVQVPDQIVESKIKPDDRGAVSNSPFAEVKEEVIIK